MSSTSLMTLLSENLDLVRRVIENEGEVANDLELAIRENNSALARKLDQYGNLLEEIDFRSAFLRDKAKSILEAARVLETKATFLRDRLKTILIATQRPLQGMEMEFALGKSTVSIEVKEEADLSALPTDLIRLKIEVDKVAVKEAWELLKPDIQNQFIRKETPRLLERMRSPLRRALKKNEGEV